jgi:hypothetical protein
VLGNGTEQIEGNGEVAQREVRVRGIQSDWYREVDPRDGWYGISTGGLLVVFQKLSALYYYGIGRNNCARFNHSNPISGFTQLKCL